MRVMRITNESREERLRDRVQTYIGIINTKHYDLRKEDGMYNLDCYDFRCDGQFTDYHQEYDFRGIFCTNSSSHQDMDNEYRGWVSFRNGWNLKQNIAEYLLGERGAKQDQLNRLNQWLETQHVQTAEYKQLHQQLFQAWLNRKIYR